MTLADVAHAEGAVRQDAENSAHYRPVRFAAGHHDHHLAGGVQEDPASPAASNHRRMNFPSILIIIIIFFFQFLIGLKKLEFLITEVGDGSPIGQDFTQLG